jgi:hypothetical protein
LLTDVAEVQAQHGGNHEAGVHAGDDRQLQTDAGRRRSGMRALLLLAGYQPKAHTFFLTPSNMGLLKPLA